LDIQGSLQKRQSAGHLAILRFIELRVVAKISLMQAGSRAVPFRNLKLTQPHESAYASVASEDVKMDLLTAINAAADNLISNNRQPIRSAVVVYLGLCTLKQFSDKKNQREGRSLCIKLLGDYKPEHQGQHSVNCSYFVKDGDDSYIDHGEGIGKAARVYLPQIRSRRKQALIFLAVGAFHSEGVPLPGDDSWLRDYRF
jgi:hypothetical protein